MTKPLHHRLFFQFIFSIFALGGFSFFPTYQDTSSDTMEEICDNAIDDDMDGLIDLNDPDCECEIIEPVSLIPNPSFEDMSCCPNNRGQLNCADEWIQASEPTTDYLHTCGWMGWDDFPPPLPFPDGQGVMGFRDGRVRQNGNKEPTWKEYAGACLLGPLEADTEYRFEFDVGFVTNSKSPPINITFFGSSDCDNLPFGVGDATFGCPTNGPGWVRLGATMVTGGNGNKWVKASIDVVPDMDINAIVIGPDCPLVNSSVSTFYFFDNLLLADLQSFQLGITTISHPCESDFRLRTLEDASLTYQWYKEGIALIGETFSELTEMYGEGKYEVRIGDGASCRVSPHYQYSIPILSRMVDKTICKDESLWFGDNLLMESGIYVDTFKTVNNCDSIVTLNLEILGALEETVYARIFEGETFQLQNHTFTQAGEHLVDFTSVLGCDSLVILQLEYFNIYIPNAFSPNEDGYNDRFKVYGKDEYILSSELKIFDRWGAAIYQGAEWDGTFDGKNLNPGIFVYLVTVVMEDGIERQFSGSVTLLR